jgi:hypothetical protein
MFVTIGNLDYMVCEHDSIFSSRRGKRDISIRVRGQWGGRYGEGNYRGLYRNIRIVDAETGEFVRDYERVPDDISVDALRRLGYVKPLEVMAV